MVHMSYHCGGSNHMSLLLENFGEHNAYIIKDRVIVADRAGHVQDRNYTRLPMSLKTGRQHDNSLGS